VPFDPVLVRSVDAGEPYLDESTPGTVAFRAAADAIWRLLEPKHESVVQDR